MHARERKTVLRYNIFHRKETWGQHIIRIAGWLVECWDRLGHENRPGKLEMGGRCFIFDTLYIALIFLCDHEFIVWCYICFVVLTGTFKMRDLWDYDNKISSKLLHY